MDIENDDDYEVDYDEDLQNDDEDEVSEDHDKEKAEEDSVASVKKAEKSGPVAKKLPKSNWKKDPAVKLTKSVVEEDEDGDDENVEEAYNFEDDLNALVNEEATLSEAFKDKSLVIFEAAINSKVAQKTALLEEAYEVAVSESVEEFMGEIVENLDSYLNFTVEKWLTENTIAVEAGLRTEISEDFMNGLKNLFVESYIDVPDSKVDLVDELSQHVQDLEEALNEQTADAIDTKKQLEYYIREAIIRDNSVGLAETQVEKLNSLAESIDYDDDESFNRKVQTLRESYFSNRKPKNSMKSLNEDFSADEDDDFDTKEVSASMARYVSAIKK